MKDKLLPKSKFPWILGSSALFIALCAAFFSVYGISTLFSGAFISAIVMASSLEIGKLVAITFLYRYWTKCKGFLKVYLSCAILVLMIITSLGIFGYLSAAYQKSSIEFGVTQEKISSIEGQKSYNKDKIDAAKKRIEDLTKLRASQESRMTEVLTNEFLSRNPLQLKQLQQQNIDLINDTDKNIKEENQKIQTSIDDVRKTDEQINVLKLGTAEKKDVQIFKFVSDALKLPLDTVARWFILSIISVFDPLSICLILAYNVAVYRKEDETVYDKQQSEETVIEPSIPDKIIIEPEKMVIEPLLPEETVTVEPSKKEEITTLTSSKVEKPKEIPSQNNQMSDWFKQMFKL